VRGEVSLDSEELGPGDAARITDAKDLEAVAVTGAELLLWEMSARRTLPSSGVAGPA
jgi:hypothetical protein